MTDMDELIEQIRAQSAGRRFLLDWTMHGADMRCVFEHAMPSLDGVVCDHCPPRPASWRLTIKGTERVIYDGAWCLDHVPVAMVSHWAAIGADSVRLLGAMMADIRKPKREKSQ